MDYRAQQTINHFGFLSKQIFPRWNSAPGKNFINPGLGQIAPLYHFYAPLTTKKSFKNEITKKLSSEYDEMAGTGLVEPDIDEQQVTSTEENASKISDGVLFSFLHPKIETDKIVFETAPKKERKRVLVQPGGPEAKKPKIEKKMAHKFQFM